MDFDDRVSEDVLRNTVIGVKGAVNSCKNQLAAAIAFGATVTAADLTRLDLTQNQKDQVIDFKAKIQDLHDYIVAQGF